MAKKMIAAMVRTGTATAGSAAPAAAVGRAKVFGVAPADNVCRAVVDVHDEGQRVFIVGAEVGKGDGAVLPRGCGVVRGPVEEERAVGHGGCRKRPEREIVVGRVGLSAGVERGRGGRNGAG